MSSEQKGSDSIAGFEVGSRGVYGTNLPGTALFVGLRSLDAFVLQPLVQQSAPALFASIAHALATATVRPGPPGTDLLRLSSWTTPGLTTPNQALLNLLSLGAAAKQIFWLLYVAREPMTVPSALIISAFNSVFNALNTAAFEAAGSNPLWSQPVFHAGLALFAAGIAIETLSEVQRKWFKDRPQNEGKPYAGGLFSLARNINYFGYTLWRTGFALAGGGLAWGAVTAAFFAYDFVNRAIPINDSYCHARYKAQWDAVRAKVPYVFVPGVY